MNFDFDLITETEVFSLDKTLGRSPSDEIIYKQIKYKGEYLNLIYTRELGWIPLRGFRSITKALNYAKEYILGENMTTEQIAEDLFDKLDIEEELKEKVKLGFAKAVDKAAQEKIDQEESTEKEIVENTEDTISIEIDTETAILEAIKQTTINSKSIFGRSKMLENLTDITGIEKSKIEDYLSSDIITESTNIIEEDNPFYTSILEALKIIQPVEKPEIKIDQNESSIWSEIRSNSDWLLESKIKNYLTAKKLEYTKKIAAHKSVAIEEFKDTIFESNKLQKQILLSIKDNTPEEKELIGDKMNAGVLVYKKLAEAYDIAPPKGSSLLSLAINFEILSETEEFKEIYEKTEEYLKEQSKGASKPIEKKAFFDYKSVITDLDFLKGNSIILKETDRAFYFNIVSEVFTQTKTSNTKEIFNKVEEKYNQDLLKSKKILEQLHKNKKFIQSKSDSVNSVSKIDTDNFRIHLYNDLKEKTLDYNIEYYPSNYKKSELTESETFYPSISELLNAKKFEKLLLSGEHIFIEDTGVVLWYSNSDKTFMIDMRPKSFKEVFDFYKKKDKRVPLNLK